MHEAWATLLAITAGCGGVLSAGYGHAFPSVEPILPRAWVVALAVSLLTCRKPDVVYASLSLRPSR